MQTRSLYHAYESIAEFEGALYQHLRRQGCRLPGRPLSGAAPVRCGWFVLARPAQVRPVGWRWWAGLALDIVSAAVMLAVVGFWVWLAGYLVIWFARLVRSVGRLSNES